MMKKIFAGLLSAVMGVASVGCHNQTNDSEPVDSTTGTQTGTSAASDVQDGTAPSTAAETTVSSITANDVTSAGESDVNTESTIAMSSKQTAAESGIDDLDAYEETMPTKPVTEAQTQKTIKQNGQTFDEEGNELL